MQALRMLLKSGNGISTNRCSQLSGLGRTHARRSTVDVLKRIYHKQSVPFSTDHYAVAAARIRLSAEAGTAAAAARTTTAAATPAAAAADGGSKKMLLIDGHNLASRAYWGMVYRSNQSFCTSDGISTTVCFGFLRSLAALLEQEQPHSLVVAFDAPAKSFRHEALQSYKAQRGPAPPGFTPDLRNLQLLLSFMRVHTVSVPGYEADDVLAGAAQQAAAAGYAVRIYSSDQDLWQVIDDAAQVAILAPITPAKGAPRPKGSQGQALTALIDEAAVIKRLGITPAQVPDFKALVGDSSDNLPGIPGIGPKTAAGLLQAWGSAEAAFKQEAMQAHSAGVRSKLQGQEQAAALHKDLTTVRREAAPKLDFGAAILSGFCADEVRPLLERLEMMSLAKPDALANLQLLFGGQAAPNAALAARVPAAKKAFELARPAPEADTEGKAAVGLLPGGDPNGSSSSSSSSANDLAQQQLPAQAAAADQAAGALPEPMYVVRTAAESGPVSLLPESLQARLPAITVVNAQQQLQQLVDQLQQHQGPVTWSWPQQQLYAPATAPALPSIICCTWDEPVRQAAADAATALPATRAARRRRTSTSSAAAAAAAAAREASSQPPQQQQPADAVVLQPRLAVIHISEQLPGAQVLTGLQPLLQDAGRSNVFFESKRCHTELTHWGLRLAGIEFDVLLAACLLDPEKWTEGRAGKQRVLDPQRQQHQALPAMVRDVLNCTLPDMAAALQAEHEAALEQQGVQQQQQLQQQVKVPEPVAAAVSSPARGSRRRRRTTAAAAIAAVAAAGEGAAHPAGHMVQQPAAAEQQQHYVALPANVWHSAAEAWASHALRGVFLQQLQQLGDGGALLSLLSEVEVPVQAVLSSMEVAGIGADREALQKQQGDLQEELAVLESRLFEIAGHPFNLSSRLQLSQVIFQELGVKPRDPKYSVPMTKATGMQSTKEEVIRQLEPHPFVATYLEWAGLNTMLTKYYNDAYIGAVQGPDPLTGRVHTTLVQVGGATGRINSVNPNLQNIPVHIHSKHAAAFRAAFNRPAPGYVLVSADYSQVELRVVAALAQEQALQEAFAAGRDVHEATARVLLDRQPGEPVDKEERQMGKRVNFSIVYGAGSSKIGKDAGLTSKEAQDFLKRFYDAYPSLFEYMTRCQRSAVARGYTSSVLGRRRLFNFSSPALQALRGSRDLASLPDMRGLMRLSNREDSEVLRQAGNAPIQGTSADILKVALLELHSVLTAPPWNCRILLTVHDSVVLEVPQAQWPAAAAEIARIMEGVLQQHQLHLKVDAKEGW